MDRLGDGDTLLVSIVRYIDVAEMLYGVGLSCRDNPVSTIRAGHPYGGSLRMLVYAPSSLDVLTFQPVRRNVISVSLRDIFCWLT